jgi:Arc/MetJ family transcription regulator
VVEHGVVTPVADPLDDDILGEDTGHADHTCTSLDVYTDSVLDILPVMAKHLVDIDEEALAAAQAEMRTETMKETVNEALRRVGAARADRVAAALTRLARRRLPPREEAWR